jgi:hypothetical protein
MRLDWPPARTKPAALGKAAAVADFVFHAIEIVGRSGKGFSAV